MLKRKLLECYNYPNIWESGEKGIRNCKLNKKFRRNKNLRLKMKMNSWNKFSKHEDKL